MTTLIRFAGSHEPCAHSTWHQPPYVRASKTILRSRTHEQTDCEPGDLYPYRTIVLAAMAQIPGTTPGLSPSPVGSNGSLHPAMASGGDDTVYGRSGIRRERWPELAKEAVERNVGTRDSDGNGEVTSGRTTWTRVRRRRLRGGTARNSREVLDKGMERRRCIKEPDSISQPAKGGAR